MKENNAKFEFLKNYIKKYKSTEDVAINDAWNMLSDFYNNLPERTKSCQERRDEFAFLIEQFAKAFDILVQKIANCPFVKIEICDEIDKAKLAKDIQEIKNETAFLLGAYNNMIYEQNLHKQHGEVSYGN